MGAPLVEVQRDGAMQLSTSAASGLRHIQELRGFVACCIHGWQRRGHVGQGRLLRAQGGGCGWGQEEVSTELAGTWTASAAPECVLGVFWAARDATAFCSKCHAGGRQRRFCAGACESKK